MESHDPALLDTAQQQLDEIIKNLVETPGESYFSLLNCGGSNTYWIPLLTQWKEALEQAPITPFPEPHQPDPPPQSFKSQVYEALILLSCLGILIYLLIGRR